MFAQRRLSLRCSNRKILNPSKADGQEKLPFGKPLPDLWVLFGSCGPSAVTGTTLSFTLVCVAREKGTAIPPLEEWPLFCSSAVRSGCAWEGGSWTLEPAVHRVQRRGRQHESPPLLQLGQRENSATVTADHENHGLCQLVRWVSRAETLTTRSNSGRAEIPGCCAAAQKACGNLP